MKDYLLYKKVTIYMVSKQPVVVVAAAAAAAVVAAAAAAVVVVVVVVAAVVGEPEQLVFLLIFRIPRGIPSQLSASLVDQSSNKSLFHKYLFLFAVPLLEISLSKHVHPYDTSNLLHT